MVGVAVKKVRKAEHPPGNTEEGQIIAKRIDQVVPHFNHGKGHMQRIQNPVTV
jgi:hypothetical protein